MLDFDSQKFSLCFKEQHSDAILCIALDHLGSIATGSKDQTVRIWDKEKMQCKVIYRGHNAPVKSVVADYNGCILSGSTDGQIKVWNSEPLSPKQKIQAAILIKAQERENKKNQKNELSDQQKLTILQAIGHA